MIALEIRFLAGRFHATPWGRHVNEGVSEWPPAPWRVLRAIVNAWYTHRADDDPDSIEILRGLLAKLSAPPFVRLPSATQGHTRHYMPWEKKSFDDKTLVFDTFVVVQKESSVRLVWSKVNLDAGERDLLEFLTERVPYLGRSESWVKVNVSDSSLTDDVNCFPTEYESTDSGSDPDPSELETVQVLCAVERDPGALFEALSTSTLDLRNKARRLEPPGTAWTPYLRKADCFAGNRRKKKVVAPSRRPVAFRYLVDGTPRPLVQETLRIGERFRSVAMGLYKRIFGERIGEALSGKDEKGRKALHHQHAFYIPSDEDSDGRIDHLTVYAERGFEPKEMEVLGKLTRLKRSGDEDDLRLMLLGVLFDVNEVSERSVIGFGKEWVSATPFVLTRHPKFNRQGAPRLNESGIQKDGPEDQLMREWSRRREIQPTLPELAALQRLPRHKVGDRRIRWGDFQTIRRSPRRPAMAGGYGFKLTFSEPVRGPVALGYGAHFGMGTFRPLPPNGGAT